MQKIIQIPYHSLWMVNEVVAEYDLYSLPDYKNPKILDIGANVGIFSINALQRWPGATIRAYEPNPFSSNLLGQNLEGWKVEIFPVAVVGDREKKVIDLFHNQNDLCASTTTNRTGGNRTKVATFCAQDLPTCDVMKIDTEGAEVEILANYKFLGDVKVLLAEIHKEEDFAKVDVFAHAADLVFLDRRKDTVRYIR